MIFNTLGRWLTADSHFYGHGEILLKAAGLPLHTAIPHRIQHGAGAQHICQVASKFQKYDPFSFSEPGPKLVWSERMVDYVKQFGDSDVIPIGAPFLYMPPIDNPPAPVPKSLLLIPEHGTWAVKLESYQKYANDLLDFLKRTPFTTVTVCLFCYDYNQSKLRAPFEANGFKVVTVGSRYNNPKFLFNLRELMLAHSVVSSNILNTATFYALSLNRPCFLWGAAERHIMRESNGNVYIERNDMIQLQRDNFPQLTWDKFDGSLYPDLADQVLGRAHLCDAETLRKYLWLNPNDKWKRRRLYVERFMCIIKRRLKSPSTMFVELPFFKR